MIYCTYLGLATFLLSVIICIKRTIVFVFFLILNIVVLVYFIISYLFLPGFLGILFLMVYLGAMMILIGYVCAVTPSTKPRNYNSFELSFLLFCFGLFRFSLPYFNFIKKISYPTYYHLSTFFYSFSGLIIFSTIVIMMILVLLLASNSITIKSPFRLL